MAVYRKLLWSTHARSMSRDAQPSDRRPSDAEQLRCEILRSRDGARVRLSGALDLATVELLNARMAELHRAGARSIVLDLSDLGFMDSTGLRCILEHDADSRRDGFSLSLVPGPPAVQRVFDITGTAELVRFSDA
jgi:anti-anti-sigma factor